MVITSDVLQLAVQSFSPLFLGVGVSGPALSTFSIVFETPPNTGPCVGPRGRVIVA